MGLETGEGISNSLIAIVILIKSTCVVLKSPCCCFRLHLAEGVATGLTWCATVPFCTVKRTIVLEFSPRTAQTPTGF